MQHRILIYPDLREKKGIVFSRVHIARLEAAGKFPKKIQYGDGRVGWLEREVDEWIEAKAAARETEAA